MTVCEVIRIHFTVCDHLSPHTAWPRSSILFVNNTVNHPWTCEITLHSVLFFQCICSFTGQRLLEHQLRNYVFIITSTDTIFQSNYLCNVFTGEKTILNRCLKRFTKLFSVCCSYKHKYLVTTNFSLNGKSRQSSFLVFLNTKTISFVFIQLQKENIDENFSITCLC